MGKKTWGGGSKGECQIIEPGSSIEGLFEEKMDLIFANQSLYYLSSSDFERTIEEFYKLCNPKAVFFATMMSTKNGYFTHSQKENEEGLSEVNIDGRLKEKSYIHFVKDLKELEQIFKPFQTLFLGEYDPICIYNFEGSVHHYIIRRGQKLEHFLLCRLDKNKARALDEQDINHRRSGSEPQW